MCSTLYNVTSTVIGAQDPSLFHGIPQEGSVVLEKENELGPGLGSLLPINL